MLDPDTTIYMKDPEDEGSCVGVRIGGFSEVLVRQVTQLILESRRCGAEPVMGLDAAKDFHVELLYRFVEQMVKNLLDNITHLDQEPPTVESSSQLRPLETALDGPCGLPTLEEELGVASSDEAIPQVKQPDIRHCSPAKSVLAGHQVACETGQAAILYIELGCPLTLCEVRL